MLPLVILYSVQPLIEEDTQTFYLPHQTRTGLDPFKLFAKMATPGELFSDEILDPFLTSKERTIPLNPNMSIMKVPLSHQYNNKDAA